MNFNKSKRVKAETNRDFLRTIIYAERALWKTYKFRSCHKGNGRYETIIIDSTAANLYRELRKLIDGMEADGDPPSSDAAVSTWIRRNHTEALILLDECIGVISIRGVLHSKILLENSALF
jgi:hypothetical protein